MFSTVDDVYNIADTDKRCSMHDETHVLDHAGKLPLRDNI